jgi:hypothetical protein
MHSIKFNQFLELKGEFEAEGLSRNDASREAIIAARQGLGYLVKIGGCEAKADIDFLVEIGVTSIVAPMIESGFAMSKYMDMIPPAKFENIGVTVETKTAVENIDEILSFSSKLTEVTIGRSDLTASYGGSDVESSRTLEMVKMVAGKARARGFHVTMGGTISKKTIETLQQDRELFMLIDYVETRKVVMTKEAFLGTSALQDALKLELYLLKLRAAQSESLLPSVQLRIEQLSKRG